MILGLQWYYWLILIVAAIGAIFAWVKAMEASKARRARLKKEAEIWQRDYKLREKYSVLTEEKIRECSDTELLHAVAMNIQVSLENAIDMNTSFEQLPDEKKFVYTLEYFDEDSKTSLSTFFKNNGAPLLPNIHNALIAIDATDIIGMVDVVYPMYDPDSEVSVNYNIINKTDEQFKAIYDSIAFCKKAAIYIRNNKEKFL